MSHGKRHGHHRHHRRHHDYQVESLNNEKQRDMSHDNHFNSEVNKSPKRYHRRGEKGGLTMRWVAFENKSKCLYVLGMSQVWVRFAIC